MLIVFTAEAQRIPGRPIQFSEPKEAPAGGTNVSELRSQRSSLSELEDKLSKTLRVFGFGDSLEGAPAPRVVPRSRTLIPESSRKKSGLLDEERDWMFKDPREEETSLSDLLEMKMDDEESPGLRRPEEASPIEAWFAERLKDDKEAASEQVSQYDFWDLPSDLTSENDWSSTQDEPDWQRDSSAGDSAMAEEAVLGKLFASQSTAPGFTSDDDSGFSSFQSHIASITPFTSSTRVYQNRIDAFRKLLGSTPFQANALQQARRMESASEIARPSPAAPVFGVRTGDRRESPASALPSAQTMFTLPSAPTAPRAPMPSFVQQVDQDSLAPRRSVQTPSSNPFGTRERHNF